MSAFNIIWKWSIVLCFTLMMIACSKLTQSNFQHIKPNMSVEEVVAILGKPTFSENMDIAGISGLSAIWKDKHVEIDIQFLNNKVAVKSYSKIRNDDQILKRL